MRILVTGGTGQIGRAAVSALTRASHDVTVLSRANTRWPGPEGVRLVQGDLASGRDIERVFADARPDALIHLAWQGLPDYSLEACIRNFDMSARLLQSASDAGCRCVVSTGSCWEYASRKGQLDEQSPAGSSGVFPTVKNALRGIGESIAATHGGDFYWLRLFFAYGPGQRATSLVPQLIDALTHGRRPEVRTPHNRHDFVHVDDIATAIAAILARRPEPGTYNVGSGVPVSVAEVVQTLHRILGRPESAEPWSVAAPEQDFWADISRIQQATGWSPRYRIDDGLRSTLAGTGMIPA